MKRYPNGVTGKTVLSASRTRQDAAWSTGGRWSTPERRAPAATHRRRPDDAALHRPARGDFAGPWFSRVSAEGSSITSRSISIRRTASLPARARRGVMGSRRTDRAENRRIPEDIRCARPAHLHSDAGGDDVRRGAAILPNRRDTGGETSTPSWRRSSESIAARGETRLRRLPAEHPGKNWRARTAPAPTSSPASRRR